jgi:hypothetical protein
MGEIEAPCDELILLLSPCKVHTVLSQRTASSAFCAESLKIYRKVCVLSKQGMLYGK